MFRTNLGVMRGLEYEHEIEYTVDGARVHTFHMGGEADFKANLVNMTKAGDVIDERGRIRLKLTAGPHVIGAAFIAPQRSDRTRRACSRSSAVPPTRATRRAIRTSTRFTVTGPYKPTGSGDTPSRRADLHLPSDDARRGRSVRAQDHRAARAPRVPRRRRPTSTCSACSASTKPGRKTGTFETGIQKAAAAHAGEPEVLLPHRAGSRRASRRRPSIASAIASSPRACRSSSGAASPTRSCWTWRRRTSSTRPPCSSSRSGACWPIRRPRR